MSPFICLTYIVCSSYTTRVCMFNNCSYWFFKLLYQLKRIIRIQNIIIRQLLPLNLFRVSNTSLANKIRPIKCTLLMRILPISQILYFLKRRIIYLWKCFTQELTSKKSTYDSIIPCSNHKCLCSKISPKIIINFIFFQNF